MVVTMIALLVSTACAGEGGSSGEAPDRTTTGSTTVRPNATASLAETAVPIDVAAELGSETYRSSGAGECTHAEAASIRGVPAAMWSVRYSGTGPMDHMRVTVWRPAGGGVDQLSLTVRAGRSSHRIDTVAGTERRGSGAVTVRPASGGGARIDVDGRDAEGSTVRLTITCARLTPAVAEGG